MRLEGKVAIVTGSASGIGFAIAKRYSQEGAKVAIADINSAQAKKAASDIGENAIAVHVDITDAESVDTMISTVAEKFGNIDTLVNNAAVFNMAPFESITPGQFDTVFNVNVRGMLFTMQAVSEHMKSNGVRGNIINMASQAGRRGEALVAVYCASKAAVISITQSAGLALIKHGINVNGIAPGVVDTDMWGEVDALFAQYEGLEIGQKKREVGLAVPYGRMGNPNDLAGAAVFLASADSDYVVAQTLNVDGGNWMS